MFQNQVGLREPVGFFQVEVGAGKDELLPASGIDRNGRQCPDFAPMAGSMGRIIRDESTIGNFDSTATP